MKKFVHPPKSINLKDTTERIAIGKRAVATLKKLQPAADSFVNLEPYNNISRLK